jgi:squalene synthase HpnC
MKNDDIRKEPSFEHVEMMRQKENFPVASWLMPKRARAGIIAFYHFARQADNIVDELDVSDVEKHIQLKSLEDALSGKIDDAPRWAQDYMALIESGRLDGRHGMALISAFIQDVDKSRYESWDDLLDYCKRSAAPVGRAVLELNEEWSADIDASDTLCNVLQLVNHLQDLQSDYVGRDRVYFSFDNEQDLQQSPASESVRRVIDESLEKVDVMLESCRHLPSTLSSFRLRVEIGAIWHIARTLTTKLKIEDPLVTSVKLSKLQYVKCFAKSFSHALFGKSSVSTVKGINKKSGSSFFRSLMDMDKDKQKAMFSLYAFCRLVDDAVDEAETPEIAKENIIYWQSELEALYSTDIYTYPRHAVTRSLLPWVKKFKLQRKYFDEILAGMAMDCEGVLIPDTQMYNQYCYRVACCVGHLSVAIFGEDNEVGHKFADELGMALQTINIMRDVYEDAQMGRIYLPKEPLGVVSLEGLTVHQILDEDPSVIHRLADVLAEMADKAHGHMDAALALVNSENGRNLKPALAMANVYQNYFDKIQKGGFRISSNRLSLSPIEKITLLFK